MNKKSLITILAILFLPLLAFFGLTFNRDTSVIAEAGGKPQIIKFSSTMCLECKEVEKFLKKLCLNTVIKLFIPKSLLIAVMI